MPRDPWEDDTAPVDPWDEPTPQPLAPGESQDQGPPAPPMGPPVQGVTAPTNDVSLSQERSLAGNAGHWQDLLSKAKALGLGAGQGALSGFADEAAGAVAALTQPLANMAGYPEQTMGQAYREARDHARLEHQRARSENPWLYGGGQIAGGLGQVGMLGAAGVNMASRGAQAVKQGAALGALSGLGGSAADLTKGEVGQAALDTGIGAGLGAAAAWAIPKATDKIVGALKNPIAKTKEALGEAAQLPQRAYEAVAERIGRTGMAQKSSSAAGDVSGPLSSAQVKALRQIRDNAELGSELARSLRAASEQLGGVGNKLVTAMSPEEKGQVAKAMAELLQTRGMRDATPDFIMQNMDGLAKSAGLELENLTGNSFLRMANKRDPQWWVSAGEGVRKFWTAQGMAGEAMDPRLQQQFASNAGLADDFALRKLDRLGRPMSEAGPGKYQFGVGEMEGKLANAEQAAARSRVAVEDAARNSTNPGAKLSSLRSGIEDNVRTDTVVTPPKSSWYADQGSTYHPEARADYLNSPAGKADLAAQMASVNDNLKARGLFGGGKSYGEAFGVQDNLAIQQAARRLQNIATGRNFLEQKALPLVGAIAGGGSGAALGVLGASKAPLVADALSEIGQGMATAGKDAIRQSALKMANDPFKLQRLADLPGVVGNGARWALEAAKEPGAFAARSYILALQPEFRKSLLGDDTDEAARSSR